MDFSARSKPALGRHSIWLGVSSGAQGELCFTTNFATRAATLHYLIELLEHAPREDQEIHLGVDFGTSFPWHVTEALGFVQSREQGYNPFDLWDHISSLTADNDDNSNNRFEVAAHLNRQIGQHYFWGLPTSTPALPSALRSWLLPKSPQGNNDPLRGCERAAQRQAHSRISSTAQLYGAGAVGSQTLLGMAFLANLAQLLDRKLNLWPFHLHGHRVTVYEIWPRLLVHRQTHQPTPTSSYIYDEHEALVTAEWMRDQDGFDTPTSEVLPACGVKARNRLISEGWILAVAPPMVPHNGEGGYHHHEVRIGPRQHR